MIFTIWLIRTRNISSALARGDTKEQVNLDVEDFLLPLESEELEELSDSLVDDEDDSEATVLRDMIMYTMESIFEAESRKEGFGGKRPGERLLKHLTNTFMPFMHADIRNAMIEFDTDTGAWTMK